MIQKLICPNAQTLKGWLVPKLWLVNKGLLVPSVVKEINQFNQVPSTRERFQVEKFLTVSAFRPHSNGVLVPPKQYFLGPTVGKSDNGVLSSSHLCRVDSENDFSSLKR